MHGFLGKLVALAKASEVDQNLTTKGSDRIGERRPQLSSLALFYLAYVLAGGFGQGLAIIPGVSITFWPPAGIFVATLLLNGKSSWPWWVAAAYLAELTCNATWFHNPFSFASIYFAANALEATAAAWLIRRSVRGPFRLESLEEVGSFVLAALTAPVVGATLIAATDAWLGKHPFWTAWPLVWLGDATGLLVSTPLALVAVQSWRERLDVPAPRRIEAIVLVIVVVLVGVLSFRGYLPTAYMSMPPLLWAAARFQLKGAAAALALIALLEAMFTIAGTEAMAGNPEAVKENMILLQTFFAISAVSALLVAALSLLHQEALQNAKAVNVDLESRIAERTASLRENQRQLRQRLTELEALHRGAPIGLGYVDRELRFQRVNQVLADINGASVEDHVSRTLREVVPKLAGVLEPIYRRILDTGEAVHNFDIVDQASDKDSGARIWLTNFEPVPGPDGKPVGVNVAVVDISERKAAEARLYRNEMRYRALIKGTSTVTWSTPASGFQIEAQPEWMEFTGQTAEEMLGDGWTDAVHPGDLAAAGSAWQKAVANGEPYVSEHRIRRHDGEWRWMSVQAVPVRDSSGTIFEWFGMNSDITDRKRQEEHQALLMNELNHRVKNTLATIQSMASQTLRSSPSLAEAKNRFEARLISLSKAHDVLTREKWSSAPLADIVDRAITPYCGSNRDRFKVSGPNIRIPAQMALAFAMMLHELCTNAVKYGALSGDKGRVTIAWKVSGKKQSKPPATLTFSWIEKGGPPVTPPTSRGFGTKLIERSLASDLGGNVKIKFAKTGVKCEITTALNESE